MTSAGSVLWTSSPCASACYQHIFEGGEEAVDNPPTGVAIPRRPSSGEVHRVDGVVFLGPARVTAPGPGQLDAGLHFNYVKLAKLSHLSRLLAGLRRLLALSAAISLHKPMTTANCPISLHKPNALSQNTSQIFECYFTILKRKLTSRAFLRHRKATFLHSLLDSEFFLLFPAELGRRSPRTPFALQTYDFRAGAGADQGGSNLRRRDCESRRASHETTFK